MPYVIKAVAFADGQWCPHEGQYLEAFDFERYAGQGYGEFTYSPAKAKKFDTIAEAMTFWKTVSKTQPTRYDGKPNRPLTALTCSIEKAD